MNASHDCSAHSQHSHTTAAPTTTARDHPRVTRFERLLAWPLIALVKVYQFTLSPILGRQCRFHPTCSWYALDALRRHGGLRGGWLTLKRLATCHPFSKGGYDPV
jgi:uncharacterized protein